MEYEVVGCMCGRAATGWLCVARTIFQREVHHALNGQLNDKLKWFFNYENSLRSEANYPMHSRGCVGLRFTSNALTFHMTGPDIPPGSQWPLTLYISGSISHAQSLTTPTCTTPKRSITSRASQQTAWQAAAAQQRRRAGASTAGSARRDVPRPSAEPGHARAVRRTGLPRTTAGRDSPAGRESVLVARHFRPRRSTCGHRDGWIHGCVGVWPGGQCEPVRPSGGRPALGSVVPSACRSRAGRGGRRRPEVGLPLITCG